MKKIIALLLFCTVSFSALAAPSNPVSELVERIHKGASSRFIFELVDQTSEDDFFVLSSKGNKTVVAGNNWVSVAAGLNWYLKYYAGIQIAWNNPQTNLGGIMPKVKVAERRSTGELMRYYLNYCTFSYSTAFWGWERWQQEIDWMALHGVNMPLAIVGTAAVWRNVLHRLGYNGEEISRFIAGPGFQAWWLMNNLEGWAGPNPDSYYDSQVKLEQQIVNQYRRWGIEPVFAGYGGMFPSFLPDGADTTEYQVQNSGKWCGYDRPSFLQPTSDKFAQVANIYYQELEKLYGRAKYYAIDPFHEGGSTVGVDLKAAGSAIFNAMRSASPASTWVIQAWQAAPKEELIGHLPFGGVVVLDLQCDGRPQWGDMQSEWYRKDGFKGHDWIYCMLLNFGGNTGLYGAMQRTIDGYYLAKSSPNGRSMVGVGATMEGIENNPMMYELIFELPWRAEKPNKEQWLRDWVKVRYGQVLPQTIEAWQILGRTAYNPPYNTPREGCAESVMCARPALKVNSVSTWGSSSMYYDEKEFLEALELMVEVGDKYRGCNNFEYDIVDVARQALSNRAYVLLMELEKLFDKGLKTEFAAKSQQFLDLILLQDKLLGSRAEFMVGPYIESAMRLASPLAPAEKDWYRFNARTLLTTWGNRTAANSGGLIDYAHREWNGLMKDYYYARWKYFFDYINKNEQLPIGFDYFDMESSWAKGTEPYSTNPNVDAINMAWTVLQTLKKEEKK